MVQASTSGKRSKTKNKTTDFSFVTAPIQDDPEHGNLLENDGRRALERIVYEAEKPSSIHSLGVNATQKIARSEVIMAEPEIISKTSLTTADGKMMSPTFPEFMEKIRNLDNSRKQSLLYLVRRRLAVHIMEQDVSYTDVQNQMNRGGIEVAGSTSEISQLADNDPQFFARNLYPGGVEQFENDFKEPMCLSAVESFLDTFYHYCVRFSLEQSSPILVDARVGDASPFIYMLFPSVGMLNHSCSPNAEASFNWETGLMVVRAIDDIECGEEITIAYQSPFKPRLKRLADLGFECYCEECTLKGEKLEIAEAQRKYITSAFQIIFAFQLEHFDRNFIHMQDVSASLCRSIMASKNTIGVGDCVEKMVERMHETGILSSIATIPMDIQCIIHQAADWKLGRSDTLSEKSQVFSTRLWQLEVLGVTIGFEHPRSQKVLNALVKMATKTQNKPSGQVMGSLVRKVLRRYSWDLRLKKDVLVLGRRLDY